MRARHPRAAATTVIAFALAGGCADLGVDAEQRPIINGEAVGAGELPTLGGIATNAGSLCTGTLISPTAVLTAAHCVEPNLLKQAMQQAGQTPPEVIEYRFSFALDLLAAGDADFLAVDSVEWHDEFLMDVGGLFERPGKWHDIAVVHLAAPVTDRPAQALATPDDVTGLDFEGSHLVAGYGLTDDDDQMSAGSLTRGWSGLDEVGDFELIAGVGDDQQACRGDSGGPIFADDSDAVQIGIASRINADLFPPPAGPPPCEPGLLYTRVDAYREWIAQRVTDLGDSPDPGDPPDDPNDPPGDPNDPPGDPGDSDPDDPADPNNPSDDMGDHTGGCTVAGDVPRSSPIGFALAALIVGAGVTRRRRDRRDRRDRESSRPRTR